MGYHHLTRPSMYRLPVGRRERNTKLLPSKTTVVFTVVAAVVVVVVMIVNVSVPKASLPFRGTDGWT